MHNYALFRQDLAFSYGTEGSIAKQDNFANLVYTALHIKGVLFIAINAKK